MLKKLVTATANLRSGISHQWLRHFTSGSQPQGISSAVNSMILRSLKDHYTEISRMNPPPRVHPPQGFTVNKAALNGDGHVLSKTHGNEEVTISVMRLSDLIKTGEEDDDDPDINQLFLEVKVSKADQEKSLHFLCALYPDAYGVHGVNLRPKMDTQTLLSAPGSYNGPNLGDLDEKMRDAFHSFVEERGVNEELFPFLQSWVYVKEHKAVMRWYKSLGTFIHQTKNNADD